ncbi:hypothetical protein ACJJTC_010093 [Scirpophaga incertulas]
MIENDRIYVDYIVLQKQKYKKLIKFNKHNLCVNIGRDTINLSGIEGCFFSSVFKLYSSSGKKNREYQLELTDEVVNLKDEIDIRSSGIDNRNIIDDGMSQKLTTAEIEDLKVDSNKASDIVESLIVNSNTFHNKTEYAQEKYLRKKEKKYFEYIQILRPNLRIIAEVMYKLDPIKIQGIRLDTLSQIMTLANIHSEGNHLLYDSGSNGLLAAALLSAIGQNTNGKLVHIHPGNMSQKQALLAMNFQSEHYNRCVSVNVYSALRQYYQGNDTNAKSHHVQNPLKRRAEEKIDSKAKVAKTNNEDDNINITSETLQTNDTNTNMEPKKPKWFFDNVASSLILKDKMDSLVIACREDPKNIFMELVEFVKPGRPFVIYYCVVEPLQQLYSTLKSQSNIAALKLTCNWMRHYQVLPERTHPEVMMNGASGFLLSGYVIS